ncbi:MAG: HD domain-containing protein [Candidatus Eisenbacteria bacterium]
MKKKRKEDFSYESCTKLLEERFASRAPLGILGILNALRSNGFKAYVVGGSVRDLLLERPVKDWDVTTDAPPAEVQRIFTKTAPTGIAHGTVTVLMDDCSCEVTTFRRDGKYLDARHPEEVFFATDIVDDLVRRDFTVNAIAYEPLGGVIVCPHEGLADMREARIRTVGDPVARFREDGLRPLRAIRFAGQLGFEIAPETFRAIGAVLDRVVLVSMERVRDEMMKILSCRRPSTAFEQMYGSGLLQLFLPELAAGRGVTQNEFHSYDVYWHSLFTCDAVPPEKPLVRLAGLLHDLGKLPTREEREGRVTFYNHQHAGARMVAEILTRFRFSNAERDRVVALVDNHMFDYHSEWSDGALRRFVKRVGDDALADAFDLRIADFLGNGLKQGFPRYLEEMRRRIEDILAEDSAFSISDLAVDGTDVMAELGVGAGERVGAVLRELLEAVLDEPALNTRETLLERLRAMKGSSPAGDEEA